MASLVYELPETYASITRPVAYEIIKQLSKNLGLGDRDPNFRISVVGATGKLNTYNSDLIKSQDTADFNTHERLIVEIKEEYIEDDLITMQVRRKDAPPIFIDERYGIYLYPVYSRTKVILSMTYRSRDRYQMESFKDYWRRKIAENREYMVFNAKYKYPIPVDIEKALYLIHHCRYINNPEFNTYQEYVFGLGSPHLTSLKNAAGKGDILAMREYQENILGNFTDPLPAEQSKDDIGAVWEMQFDFEYHYEKPISMTLEYPIIIHNTLIPWQLYPPVYFDIAKLKSHSSFTKELYTIISQDGGFQWHIERPWIRIPEFDDWEHYLELPYTKTLLTALAIVEDENPKFICNLKELGDWGLHPVLHDAFSKHSHFLTLRNEAPFYIRLFRNNDFMGDDAIRIDKDLNIYAKHAMKKENMYHLTIDLCLDISTMNREAQQRFFRTPDMVYAYMDIILGRRPLGGYPKVNKGNGRYDNDYFMEREGYTEEEWRRVFPSSHHYIDKNNDGYDDITGRPINVDILSELPEAYRRKDYPEEGNYSGKTDIINEQVIRKRFKNNDIVDVEDYKRIMELNGIVGKCRYLGIGSVIATVGVFSVVAHNQGDLNKGI